jgi:catechol 2,3-dioxygenase-like lactoylglutathione lyase family enzyme
MPARAIHHVDLAVSDVERSLAFYLAVLGPLGLHESERYPTYRGTEEVFTFAMASVLRIRTGWSFRRRECREVGAPEAGAATEATAFSRVPNPKGRIPPRRRAGSAASGFR